ncbi:hypothetical protein E2C01_011903 [Portunus trituberculatus]|uniref:Uncharacterized protein n=1 Tax=Portunus trituberculatus TaxID=210409 RepID=A0A5B7DCF1_PORTR|nr:hypothetical protein [Portunus trituberculatus]
MAFENSRSESKVFQNTGLTWALQGSPPLTGVKWSVHPEVLADSSQYLLPQPPSPPTPNFTSKKHRRPECYTVFSGS